MPRGVGVPEGVIQGIALAIVLLRIGRVRHNHIRRGKSANAAYVKTGVHVHQSQVVVVFVPRKTHVRHLVWPAAVPVAAKGQVTRRAAGNRRASGRGSERSTAEVVGVQKVEGVAATHHLHSREALYPSQDLAPSPHTFRRWATNEQASLDR